MGLGFVLGAVVSVKIMGIVGEARPASDVSELPQGAAEMVPNGQNPYAVHNAGAAARISGFGHPTPTYPYMPAVWLVTFPFAGWLGDARYAYVLTDILAAVLLLVIGRREGVSARLRRYAELSALLVMFASAASSLSSSGRPSRCSGCLRGADTLTPTTTIASSLTCLPPASRSPSSRSPLGPARTPSISSLVLAAS